MARPIEGLARPIEGSELRAGSSIMRKLVSPDHVLHIVADQAALETRMSALGLESKLKGNLRQLCGYDQVGGDRHVREFASGWTLLENVRWLQRDGIEFFLPTFGSARQIREKVPRIATGKFSVCVRVKRIAAHVIRAAAGGQEILTIHSLVLRIKAGGRPILKPMLRIEAGDIQTLILNTPYLTVKT